MFDPAVVGKDMLHQSAHPFNKVLLLTEQQNEKSCGNGLHHKINMQLSAEGGGVMIHQQGGGCLGVDKTWGG